MLTRDSRKHEELRLLVLNPERNVDASDALREACRRIHDFFIRERGWGPTELARHRFKDLEALAAPGDFVMARTSGAVDWARAQDDLVLHLSLKELRSKKGRAAKIETARRLTGGSVTATPLEERRLALSREDWAYIDALVTLKVARTDKKSRRTGAQLAHGVKTLLENAYGRQPTS